MKVLFRIDDLGLSLGINRAIMQSIDFQLVKNIGIIVNLPYSKEGLEFAKHHNKLCFGLHVNLVLGRPCSEVAENSSLIHSGMGNFISSSTRRIELNSEKDLFDCDDTYNEVKAQIEKFIHTTGRKPDYIDQHAVSTPTTNKVVKCLAIEYQIP
ncbi:ChbG/HpnK family deacetylase, partial [Enterococcus sp. 3H8_DIV0648]|uniref:ChbG/HpnK family deacetylase n=2 Tax=Enterococcus TaxID=1350 RepID=UPI000B6DCC47